MIFERLSLEFWLAGRPLPWNKHRNPEKVDILLPVRDTRATVISTDKGIIRFGVRKDTNARFNLKD